MDNKNGAGPGALEKFFAGKGFYIVLLLCAAVIGVSAWSLLSGRGTVEEDDALDVYMPAVTAQHTARPEDNVVAEPPETVSETPIVQPTPAPTAAPTPTPEPADTAPESWVWPVSGSVERPHSVDALLYDTTMGDWRTHDGIDIKADAGTQVLAASSGTVLSVADDDLMGTTVVIAHDGGYETTYSNLQSVPTVAPEQYVSAGQVIGAVGTTSLAEASMSPHLHFSVTKDGEIIDPQEFLKS